MRNKCRTIGSDVRVVVLLVDVVDLRPRREVHVIVGAF